MGKAQRYIGKISIEIEIPVTAMNQLDALDLIQTILIQDMKYDPNEIKTVTIGEE